MWPLIGRRVIALSLVGIRLESCKYMAVRSGEFQRYCRPVMVAAASFVLLQAVGATSSVSAAIGFVGATVLEQVLDRGVDARGGRAVGIAMLVVGVSLGLVAAASAIARDAPGDVSLVVYAPVVVFVGAGVILQVLGLIGRAVQKASIVGPTIYGFFALGPYLTAVVLTQHAVDHSSTDHTWEFQVATSALAVAAMMSFWPLGWVRLSAALADRGQRLQVDAQRAIGGTALFALAILLMAGQAVAAASHADGFEVFPAAAGGALEGVGSLLCVLILALPCIVWTLIAFRVDLAEEVNLIIRAGWRSLRSDSPLQDGEEPSEDPDENQELSQ